jgi:hypothetical protein
MRWCGSFQNKRSYRKARSWSAEDWSRKENIITSLIWQIKSGEVCTLLFNKEQSIQANGLDQMKRCARIGQASINIGD